jgi:hypothetical protein
MTIVIALLLLASACRVDAQAKLVADPYPGSVALKLPEGFGGWKCARIDSWQSGFLSKEDPAKIAAHYKPKAKKEEPQTDGSRCFVLDEWPSGGEMGPHQALARVFPRASAKEEDLPVFEKMQNEVHSGVHTQAEYDKVYAKYQHLNNAFFAPSPTSGSGGKTQDVQEALYAEYMAKVEAEEKALNSDAKETGKKIQELMKQGRTAEAGELMKQISGKATAAGKKDNWPMWLEFLEKVNKEAYATLYVIDQGRGRK